MGFIFSPLSIFFPFAMLVLISKVPFEIKFFSSTETCSIFSNWSFHFCWLKYFIARASLVFQGKVYWKKVLKFM
jgi:hypothetical protein